VTTWTQVHPALLGSVLDRTAQWSVSIGVDVLVSQDTKA